MSYGTADVQERPLIRTLADTNDHFREITGTVAALRDRLRTINGSLAGNPVKDTPPNGLRPVPSGLCSGLSESASSIASDLAHIDDEISRLSAALGFDRPPSTSR